MRDLAASGYTADAVRAALHAAHGTRNVSYRYDLLDKHNVRIGPLAVEPGARIMFNALADIKGTARFAILEESAQEIDWLSHRIQPWYRLHMPDGGVAEWPLGVYMMCSPTRAVANGVSVREVEAYDTSLILRDDRLEDRLFLPAGTLYQEAMETLLGSSGAQSAQVERSDYTLKTDREFEPGLTKAEVVQTLATEANYRSLYVDGYGTFRLQRYVPPDNLPVSYVYADDDLSVIRPGSMVEIDAYDTPNVIVGLVSNPETAPMTSTWVNDDPASALSIQRRGRRIVRFERLDNIAAQDALDGYVQRLGNETLQQYEHVTISTATMPMHECNDILQVRHRDIGDYRYTETGWEMELRAGGAMTHKLRRLVTL